jgi:hypothetical protein
LKSVSFTWQHLSSEQQTILLRIQGLQQLRNSLAICNLFFSKQDFAPSIFFCINSSFDWNAPVRGVPGIGSSGSGDLGDPGTLKCLGA